MPQALQTSANQNLLRFSLQVAGRVFAFKSWEQYNKDAACERADLTKHSLTSDIVWTSCNAVAAKR
jgi:hypothetical protein